ncbi:hypothetical protein L202_02378 [Cryptococcus amylolentus CBS 6039]|uniref:histidine kinase n=1 Tax=Cryptococcus amylolentus CBS 6039 TaxID=1295533 RepID=A0A1E3I0E1_9TREE|nr:hypothetical protein L202_02378 [Cryptococcus amylolentus CBS 6039]ODN82062.1 hypothetical protein L202_02378 [Cryptococcus amylolentus CBS 6039]
MSQPPSPRSTQSRVPPSSAAFLQQLHSDPSSNHITLSNHRVTAPHSLVVPLEPTVSDTPHGFAPQRAHTSPVSPMAGPSVLSSLGRKPSKRGRPKTAPSRPEDGAAQTGYESPELPDSIPPQPEPVGMPATDADTCLNMLAAEEGLAPAMDALAVSNEPKTYILGRAGSLTGTPESQTGHSRPTIPTGMNWAMFSQAYSHGLFDPNKVPNPPSASTTPNTTDLHSTRSSPGQQYAMPPSVPRRLVEPSSSSDDYSSKSSKGSKGSTMTSVSSAPSTSSASFSSNSRPMSMSASLAARKKAFELEHLPLRPNAPVIGTDKLALPSYSLAAATVRMASTSFLNDFSPLAIPSPERELVDPMASVTTGDTDSMRQDSASSDPGSSRFPLHHSMSSAANPYTSGLRLPTIQASPVSTPLEGPHRPKIKERSPPRVRHGLVDKSKLPVASAPLEKTIVTEHATDYFGAAATATSPPETNSTSSTVTDNTPKPPLNSTATSTQQVPPLTASSQKVPLPAVPVPSDMATIYEQYGWLPAPVPPDEIARRRALYRFNILNTAADINFNRIAHMAKLVFNPKIVLLTLIDSDQQWYKTGSGVGMGSDRGERVSSICSHAILPRSDEPFVVLDTSQDWRFENNPNVVGPPHVRFYAGAPLRTSDGHNIGTLCIIDDKPRSEFTPRSRLILKEFAAVAMREMELWRDKLQLRVRDKIQTSMEKFTRECLEMDTASASSNADAAAKMDQVYSRAAQLVCSTIGLDGCFILDTGQIETITTDTPEGKKVTYRANPYSAEHTSPVLERSEAYGPVNPFPVLAAVPPVPPTRALSSYEHEKLSEFLENHRDGRIFEGTAPLWIRYMFPSKFRFGMAVPIFGVDQHPFAMICAYTANPEKQFLEGYELQFLRAIGVIILSAVLRRRMVMADKTKSILISSVSHELRTPLHGILASAELLSDTPLDSNQLSFLKTVQTCGNSLIETVNHVLDFTKLSGGNSNKTTATDLDRVNLASLVEQTVEGCWIGQRARLFLGDNDIGSFYAPPSSAGYVPKSQRTATEESLSYVETVIDIDLRQKGWNVRCEKGGLRRVLMNLVGNSFKFTKDGYVQISLREMPHPPNASKIPIEMTVIDTGKGIGKDFLKDQLFHPFSQENPLQTGTGLGLAIVNSIVRSESVNGKVDVWSAEGVGTEIKVTFEAEVIDEDDGDVAVSSSSSVASNNTAISTFGRGISTAFVSFLPGHQGHMLLCEVLIRYVNYWQFEVKDASSADIIIINDDDEDLESFSKSQKPLICLAVGRKFGTSRVVESINRSGGFCRVVFKPVGPTALQKALVEASEWIEERDQSGERDPVGDHLHLSIGRENVVDRPSFSRGSSGASQDSASTISGISSMVSMPRPHIPQSNSRLPLQRRRSEENEQAPRRPSMAPRGMTFHSSRRIVTPGLSDTPLSSPTLSQDSPTSTLSTISLADGGVMLKAAAVLSGTPRKERKGRVMVVEDNAINRRVLAAFLRKKGFEYAEAVDGQEGVDLFESSPPNTWDVVLMDITMPILNGHQATRAIRRIEALRRNNLSDIPMVPPPGRPVTIPPQKIVQARTKIFALTGLATPDDKREAFGSGVDGYLVKPVSLASLDIILRKIGF